MANVYEWYIPDILKPIEDYKALGASVDFEVKALETKQQLIYDNSFLISCDDETLTTIENNVGISYSKLPSNAVRRANLFILIGKSTPFTWRRFVNIINQILDESTNQYAIVTDFNNYTIELKTRTVVTSSQIDFIRKFVISTMPANIKVDYSTLYNTWAQVSKYKWSAAASYKWDFFSEDWTIV